MFDVRPIICHGARFAFIPIAKNASTTLKKIVCDLDYDKIPYSKVHENFQNKNRIEALQDIPSYYITFAVWRDPIDRARSLYINKWIPNKSSVKTRVNDSMDTFLEWLSYPVKEEHFSHQHRWVIPQHIDFYINIKDLNHFIDNVISLQPETYNESESDFQFSNSEKLKIIDIYEHDYYLKQFINYG